MSIQDEFQKNIQNIAKTKELTEKTDKALRDIEEAKKAKIDVVRLATGVEGGNTKDTGAGGNASGNSVTVNTATGTLDSLVVPATGAANNNSAQPTTTQQTLSQLEAAAARQAAAANAANGSNDLSQAIKDALADAIKGSNNRPGGGGGGGSTGSGSSSSPNMGDKGNASGSNVVHQSSPLDSGTIEGQIAASMYAKGATPEQVNFAIEAYRMYERGVHEVGAVMDGHPSTPALVINSNTNKYWDELKTVDTLEGVVGVDPDDESKAVVVRFDNHPLLPNPADVIAANQNPWPIDGINAAPRKGFIQGWQWSNVYGGPTPAWSDLDAPTLAGIVAGFPGTGHQIYRYETLVDGLGNPVQVNSYMKYTDNFGNPHEDIGAGVYIASACIPGSNANCPVEAPVEQAWPVTGAYSLAWILGKVGGSIFDTDLPLKYKVPTSVMNIKSNYNGKTYVITAGIEGGVLMYEDVDNPPYALYYGADRTLQAIPPNEVIQFYKAK